MGTDREKILQAMPQRTDNTMMATSEAMLAAARTGNPETLLATVRRAIVAAKVGRLLIKAAEQPPVVRAIGAKPLQDDANAKAASEKVFMGAALGSVGNWISEKAGLRLVRLEAELVSEVRAKASNQTTLFAAATKRITTAYADVAKLTKDALQQLAASWASASTAGMAEHHEAVPAGKKRPIQIVASTSFTPASAIVGTSGNIGCRRSEVTARGLSLPALAMPMVGGGSVKAMVISPVITAVLKSALDL